PSETLSDAGPLEWMLSVRSRHFAAQPRCGKDLAGIAEAIRIECASQALHGVEIVLTEHLRHVRFLVSTHAVLAGDGSSSVDTVLKDFSSNRFGMFCLAGDRFVVADERVQIAVARVKDIADGQTGPSLEIANAAKDLRKFGARNDTVLHVVAWRDPPHRGECGLPSLP